MLCFAAWGQAIFTGAPRWFAQLRPADPTRQAAIGDLNTIRGEQLLGANGVAARLGEGRCDPFAACVRLSRDTSFARYLRWRLAQNMPHRVTCEFEQPADLAQAVALRLQHMHARTDLRGYHWRLTGR